MITVISILAAIALSIIFFSVLKLLNIKKLKKNNTNVTTKYHKQRKLYYYLLITGAAHLILAIALDLSMRI